MMQGSTKTKTAVRLFALMIALLTVAAATACGRGPIQSGDVDQSKTVSDLSIRGRITFSETNIGSEEDTLASRAIVKAFEAAFTGVDVIFEEAARATFSTRISAGDIGDVFWGDEADMYNFHKIHNAVMPLDSYIQPLNIDLGDVYSGALDTGKSDGRLYMAPRNIGEHIMTYNVDMLTAEGISYDGIEALDWETFKSYCKMLTKFDDSGKVTQTGSSMKIYWYPVWQVFFRGFGGTWIDPVKHTVSIVDSTEVMQGLNEMLAGVTEGWIYPEDFASGITGEVSTMFSLISNDNFSTACFKTFGDLSGLNSVGNAYDRLNVAWDFCPFPALPTHTVSTGATGYMVYNRTDNPDTAAAFALFFLTPDGQRAYHSQAGGNVPLLKSLSEETFWKGKGTVWTDKNYGAFVSYPELTRPASVDVQAPGEIAALFNGEHMKEALSKILSGKADANTVFSKIQTEANEKWSLIYE